MVKLEELKAELVLIRAHAENLVVDGKLSQHTDKSLNIQAEAQRVIECCNRLETKLEQL